MAILPLQLARVSNNLRAALAQRTLSRTQAELLRVQNQLATGRRLNAPSDDPADAAGALHLRKALEQQAVHAKNLQKAAGYLAEVDTTLASLLGLLREAQTIASANAGSDVTADQRSAAAAVVESILTQAINLGNQRSQGTYLFAGDAGTTPFVATDQGIKFVGSDGVLSNAVAPGVDLPFTVNGNEVFAALSTRVQGKADLTPALDPATRLADLRGATGQGVRLGAILISNGSVSRLVDLAGADSIADVAAAINAAGVGSITASVDPAGGRLVLTGAAGEDLTVREAGGTTAADLGILREAGAGPGLPIDGQPLRPAVNALTRLSDLRGGLGLDPAGLRITNGPTSVVVDLAGAVTVEDLLNRVNSAGVGVLARVNAAGTGLDFLNTIQGSTLTIAEEGGQTATQLGVRSFGPDSPLSELNFGKGVRTRDSSLAGPDAAADLLITRRDGSSFTVDLDGALTVQDVLDRINAADGGGGLTASFATAGNGIVLTDSTGGAGTLTVASMNYSMAAEDLGLLASPAAGATLTGADVNGVAGSGLLGNLKALRDALLRNDGDGITAAAGAIEADLTRVTNIAGRVGAQVREIESRQQRLEDQDLATRALLAQLEEVSYDEAVIRFQSLQTALQANLQTTARMLNLSLMDFLS